MTLSVHLPILFCGFPKLKYFEDTFRHLGVKKSRMILMLKAGEQYIIST